MIRVLGVDSSLSTFGLALVMFDEGRPTWCAVSVHKTKGDDVSARLREHYRILHDAAEGFLVGVGPGTVLGVEAQAYVPGRMRWSTIAALGRARQVVDDVGTVHRLSVVEIPAAEVGRRAVDRKGKATKADRVASLRERFPLFGDALAAVPRASLHEHAADAFAVALATAARCRP